MTTSRFVLNTTSINDDAELPRPDKAAATIAAETNDGAVRSRALPNVEDNGRISFGAACRIPVRN